VFSRQSALQLWFRPRALGGILGAHDPATTANNPCHVFFSTLCVEQGPMPVDQRTAGDIPRFIATPSDLNIDQCVNANDLEHLFKRVGTP
jgi:hypothetical protein